MSKGKTRQTPPRIFISYRIADTLPIADRLAVELKRKFGPDQIFFDRRTVEPGDTWDVRIETAVKSAEIVLVLIGQKWLTEQGQHGHRRLDLPDDWVRREVEEALVKDGRVVPLVVEGVSPPPAEAFTNLPSIAGLASCQAAKLRTTDWDTDFAALVALLTERVPLLPTPEPFTTQDRPRTKPMNLPYGSLGSLFKGREGLLGDIRAGFEGEPGQAQAIVARHAIHGLGGIGKTRAAVEYAWCHAADYRALLFVTAQSPEDLDSKLAALCDLLSIAQGVTEQDERVRAALAWLSDPANLPWLLIVDNVDTIEAAQAVHRTLTNLTGGHLLITGRLRRWPRDIRARQVEVLGSEAARDFLLEGTADQRRAAADDPEQAKALAKELGYLALALEQAAAFIGSRALSFSEYLDRWRAADRQVREWNDEHTMQYERPLATTWQTSIEELPPAARALLDLLAWLAAEPLPRFLFDHSAAPEGTGHLFEGREDPREILGRLCGEGDADPQEALAALRDLSLLQPAEETEWPSEGQVHRVLALITRERQVGEARTAALNAALAMVDAATVGVAQDVRSWPVLEPLQPHARVLVDHAEAAGIAEPTARLLNALGRVLHNKARYAEAEPLMRRALAIDEASYGPEHPKVAIRLNNLATLLQATNRLGDAEPLKRRALAIDEASYGPEHPNVAIDLNNLAQLLQDTNRLGEAEPLLRRVVDIFEVSLGSEHPNVAIGLNNLATLLQATNRLGEAEPLMRRALAIDEASYGPEHPNVAIRLNNLAGLLRATNRLGGAETLYRRALAIDEASYGPEHPMVAIRLNNLAGLLQATNRLGEAEPLMRRALAIDEASYGPEHPNVAICLNNLAGLLRATNRLGEAEPLMRRALAIDEASYGPEHPEVALGLNNLAQLLQDTNRLAEAEPLMRRSLVILFKFTRDTGHRHPHLQTLFNNYSKLLQAMDLPEGEPERRIASLGPEAGFDEAEFEKLLEDL